LGSKRLKYDLFGHSAGGQLVHRLVMFSPENKIDRAIAANSGWYTVLDRDTVFPYGIKEAPIDKATLQQSLAKKLVVFLGEFDNKNETRET